MLNFIKKHAISIKISRHASKPIIQAILKILKIETGKLNVPQNKTKDNCFNCGAAGHWAHSYTELKKETRTCHYCNKVGHIKPKCFKFLKDTGTKNYIDRRSNNYKTNSRPNYEGNYGSREGTSKFQGQNPNVSSYTPTNNDSEMIRSESFRAPHRSQ